MSETQNFELEDGTEIIVDDTTVDVDLDDSGESTDDSVLETKDSEEDDNQSSEKGKAKSNWKKLLQKNKDQARRIQELEASSSDDNSEDVKPKDNKSVDTNTKLEVMEFVLDNPDAKEYKSEILKVMETYAIDDVNKAFTFAKAENPQSDTKNDFSLKSEGLKKKKRVSDLTEEEAVQLPNHLYLQWDRAQKKRSPFG